MACFELFLAFSDFFISCLSLPNLLACLNPGCVVIISHAVLVLSDAFFRFVQCYVSILIESGSRS
jgi:hypothetical protein